MDSKKQPPTYEDVVQEKWGEFPKQGENKLDGQTIEPDGTKRLYIDREGGTSSGSLQTNILDTNGSVVYASCRPSFRSGEFTLLDSFSNEIIKTKHHFGPRSTELHYCQPSSTFSSTTMGGNISSRDMKFNGPMGKVFEWRYEAHKGTEPHLIILSEKNRKDQIAKLVRTGTVELVGSSACTGELVLSPGATNMMDEPLVVATCLVMIRKEINRNKLQMQGPARAGFLGGGLFLGA